MTFGPGSSETSERKRPPLTCALPPLDLHPRGARADAPAHLHRAAEHERGVGRARDPELHRRLRLRRRVVVGAAPGGEGGHEGRGDERSEPNHGAARLDVAGLATQLSAAGGGSSRPASLSSPRRIRPLTVPSGTCSRAAISLWLSPPKYPSSSTRRWASGSVPSATPMAPASTRRSASSSVRSGASGSCSPSSSACAVAAAAPDRVDRPVAGDRQQPGGSRAALGRVALAIAPERHEGLLRDVLGGRAIAQHPIARARTRTGRAGRTSTLNAAVSSARSRRMSVVVLHLESSKGCLDSVCRSSSTNLRSPLDSEFAIVAIDTWRVSPDLAAFDP